MVTKSSRRNESSIRMSKISFQAGICIAALTLGAAFPVYAQPSAAAAEIRFQELEREIRRLTGQIEEQNYEIRRLKEELESLRAKVDNAVPKPVDFGEGRGPAQPARPPVGVGAELSVSELDPSSNLVSPDQVGIKSQVNEQNPSQSLGTLTKKSDTGSVTSKDSAPLAYDYAYSFIKSRDFARAEAEFSGFLTNYPSHELAANAQYWFGETFYVRGNYDRSAREFAKGYQKFPKGPKASSNLLKLGMSLVGLGKTQDACIAFKQLKSEYKGASVPVLKRADSEMAKINCG